EAGIEHLGRGTARAVDELIVVVEPGRKSIETAYRIKDLSAQINIPSLSVVGNKIRGEKDKDYLLASMSGFDFLGFISFDETIIQADLEGSSLWEKGEKFKREIEIIVQNLKEKHYEGK
ncbi:carbon monoxide dehydrogenase, partial [Candidatus Aerophobetes bacterium]|nr:carbon monoxide dehydrogenase [Candidatus Aerophobetes bacterium]